jgi:hypothetical protein
MSVTYGGPEDKRKLEEMEVSSQTLTGVVFLFFSVKLPAGEQPGVSRDIKAVRSYGATVYVLQNLQKLDPAIKLERITHVLFPAGAGILQQAQQYATEHSFELARLVRDPAFDIMAIPWVGFSQFAPEFLNEPRSSWSDLRRYLRVPPAASAQPAPAAVQPAPAAAQPAPAAAQPAPEPRRVPRTFTFRDAPFSPCRFNKPTEASGNLYGALGQVLSANLKVYKELTEVYVQRKLDGWRVLISVDSNGDIFVHSKANVLFRNEPLLSQLRAQLRGFPAGVLDGQLVAYDSEGVEASASVASVFAGNSTVH